MRKGGADRPVTTRHVATKRAVRKRARARQKKAASGGRASVRPGVKTWTPGDHYELLQAGDELPAYPSTPNLVSELNARHLWHFKNKDPAVQRCSDVEGLNKYESVFRVATMPAGVYTIPIHDHLEQITLEYDVGRAEEILENGVPYFPDKRLRRLRNELAAESSSREKRKKKKKKSATGARTEKSTRMTEQQRLTAVIPQCGVVSNSVNASTASTLARNKSWGTDKPALADIPSYAKILQLRKGLKDAFNAIGACSMLTSEEIAARWKTRDVKADREASKPKRRRKSASKASAASATEIKIEDESGADEDDANSRERFPAPRPLPYEDDYVADYSDDDWYLRTVDAETGIAPPPLTVDDLDDSVMGARGLESRADGTQEPSKYTSLEHADREAVALKKKKTPTKKKKRKRRPTDALTPTQKVDLFVERCFEDAAAPSVPPEWRVLIDMAGLTKEMKLAAVKASAQYTGMVAFSQANL